MSKLQYINEGGFAGIGLRRRAEIDTGQLPADAQDSLSRLTEEIHQLGGEAHYESGMPDTSRHTIEWDHQGTRMKIMFDDGSVPDSVTHILEILSGLAKPEPHSDRQNP